MLDTTRATDTKLKTWPWQGCSDSRQGCLSLAMSTGADPPRILALTVADSIDVDDAGGGAKGRIVRGSVLLEFPQVKSKPKQPTHIDHTAPARCSSDQRCLCSGPKFLRMRHHSPWQTAGDERTPPGCEFC